MKPPDRGPLAPAGLLAVPATSPPPACVGCTKISREPARARLWGGVEGRMPWGTGNSATWTGALSSGCESRHRSGKSGGDTRPHVIGSFPPSLLTSMIHERIFHKRVHCSEQVPARDRTLGRKSSAAHQCCSQNTQRENSSSQSGQHRQQIDQCTWDGKNASTCRHNTTGHRSTIKVRKYTWGFSQVV